MNQNTINRRNFRKTASLASGAVVFGVPALLRGQNLNSKLNIAIIGAGGKGASDTVCCSTENIVALCDVDGGILAKQLEKYPGAKGFQDFRKMFSELGKGIDAVDIATPDHFHGIAAAHAMRQGKHVYCQKPLVQTIHEARYLRDLARKTGLVTQMGNQGSAADGLRRAVECIQAGIIGKVSEVHVWTNRPVWPQGMNRPEGSDPVPENLNWDIWLGPAPVRPFKSGVYHGFKWRGWQDFGTGALGDMACHTVNMPFRALQLGHPKEISSEAFGVMNKETYPIGSKIHFKFPARSNKGNKSSDSPVSLWWYDGGQVDATKPNGHDFSNKPPKELLKDIEVFRGEVPNSACLIVGENGTIFSPDDYGQQFFVKLKNDEKYVSYSKHPEVEKIPQTIERNQFKPDATSKGSGDDLRHHMEWINAIKANKPQNCYSRFEIAAQLTEIMLLGCVALQVGKKLDWDGEKMKAKNCPEAAPFIKRNNRAGWAMA